MSKRADNDVLFWLLGFWMSAYDRNNYFPACVVEPGLLSAWQAESEKGSTENAGG